MGLSHVSFFLSERSEFGLRGNSHAETTLQNGCGQGMVMPELGMVERRASDGDA